MTHTERHQHMLLLSLLLLHNINYSEQNNEKRFLFNWNITKKHTVCSNQSKYINNRGDVTK